MRSRPRRRTRGRGILGRNISLSRVEVARACVPRFPDPRRSGPKHPWAQSKFISRVEGGARIPDLKEARAFQTFPDLPRLLLCRVNSWRVGKILQEQPSWDAVAASRRGLGTAGRGGCGFPRAACCLLVSYMPLATAQLGVFCRLLLCYETQALPRSLSRCQCY